MLSSPHSSHTTALNAVDPEIAELIREEEVRQDRCIRLIPAEN